MDIAKIIPMAFVMIAGPQLLSAIFLATSERWKADSPAYIAGAALSISIVVTAAYYLSSGASKQGASDDALYAGVLVLLVLAAAHVYLTRETSEPPKWMGKLQTASPGLSFKLGFLLLGFFPTDLLTSFAVGSTIHNDGGPLWHFLPFLGVTLLFLAIPSLMVVALGDRGKELLPRVRNWMNENSWVVSEVVIAFFVVMTLSDLV